ncbi:hypothetical protein [Pseudomonas sp. NA-150]|uniref:hypothetical protein n=1 Tax=Pseudomonas sp. NA-150 TaxID=3367525 RepID=UPI0037C61AB8
MNKNSFYKAVAPGQKKAFSPWTKFKATVVCNSHIFLSAAIATILFSVPFYGYLVNNTRTTDMWVHLEYAQQIGALSDIKSPHFLYQLLLKLLHFIFGISYENATVLALALCYGGMAAILCYSFHKTSVNKSKFWILVLIPSTVLIASHIFIQSAFQHNFYYGYVAPIVYHNPTQNLSKLISLLIMTIYYSVIISNSATRKGLLKLALPILIILSALAKPSFLIVFLPCAAAVELYRFIFSSRRQAVYNFILIAMPAVTALIFQYLMTFSSPQAGNGLAFAPFLVYGGASDVISKLPGALLFPLVTLCIAVATRRLTPRLIFSWFMLVVGLGISFCVVESGPRMMQGNFAWTGQTVIFLLYAESAFFLFSQPFNRAWAGWTALIPHVACGVVWFIAPTLFSADLFL